MSAKTVEPDCMNVLSDLFLDLEYFISDGLKGENLSKKAKEKRDAFIRRIQELKLGYVFLQIRIEVQIF